GELSQQELWLAPRRPWSEGTANFNVLPEWNKPSLCQNHCGVREAACSAFMAVIGAVAGLSAKRNPGTALPNPQDSPDLPPYLPPSREGRVGDPRCNFHGNPHVQATSHLCLWTLRPHPGPS